MTPAITSEVRPAGAVSYIGGSGSTVSVIGESLTVKSGNSFLGPLAYTSLGLLGPSNASEASGVDAGSGLFHCGPEAFGGNPLISSGRSCTFRGEDFSENVVGVNVDLGEDEANLTRRAGYDILGRACLSILKILSMHIEAQ